MKKILSFLMLSTLMITGCDSFNHCSPDIRSKIVITTGGDNSKNSLPLQTDTIILEYYRYLNINRVDELVDGNDNVLAKQVKKFSIINSETISRP